MSLRLIHFTLIYHLVTLFRVLSQIEGKYALWREFLVLVFWNFCGPSEAASVGTCGLVTTTQCSVYSIVLEAVGKLCPGITIIWMHKVANKCYGTLSEWHAYCIYLQTYPRLHYVPVYGGFRPCWGRGKWESVQPPVASAPHPRLGRHTSCHQHGRPPQTQTSIGNRLLRLPSCNLV